MGRDPHLAIMAADEIGSGLRLSAAEVHMLAFDSAIATRAAVTAGEMGMDVDAGRNFSWHKASARFATLSPKNTESEHD